MKLKIALLVSAVSLLVLLGLAYLPYRQWTESGAGDRVWHHELAADADLTIGTTSVPADGIVDETFASHLPLVIIDTHGEEIVNYKYFDVDTDSFIYQEGVDPYVDIQISFIDNSSHVNTLSDSPTMVSDGRIKIRGNSSASPDRAKKQYLLKLENTSGEKNSLPVLGMDPSDTWIINGTMTDRSYIRNYITFNTAGELDPFTPDIRMCEVVLKQGDQYEYIGLYGVYEKIEQGVGRVDMPPVSNPISISDRSYILLRDRMETDGYSMAVWSTQNQRSTNWINLEYPSPENITDEYWEYIQQDIQKIEDALYSDNQEKFLQYRSLLDVDSFVDYYIINEFFANYDAGWNSTYMYKTASGKVAIGPVWDFDGAMDNYETILLQIDAFAFDEAPWFDRLILDPYFSEKVVVRYQQLRDGILSSDTISRQIDAAAAFLEYPAKRDMSRWEDLNTYDLAIIEDSHLEVEIDRNTGTFEGEVQRVKDILVLHGEFMDQSLSAHLSENASSMTVSASLAGWLVIVVFFVSAILIQRLRKGQ